MCACVLQLKSKEGFHVVFSPYCHNDIQIIMLSFLGLCEYEKIRHSMQYSIIVNSVKLNSLCLPLSRSVNIRSR